jgi:hypothetical protein
MLDIVYGEPLRHPKSSAIFRKLRTHTPCDAGANPNIPGTPRRGKPRLYTSLLQPYTQHFRHARRHALIRTITAVLPCASSTRFEQFEFSGIIRRLRMG